jgi:hypothetical protein
VADVRGLYLVQLVVNDGTADSVPDTVRVTTENSAPVAEDQSVATDEDTVTPITLTATDVDGDSLTYSVVNPPAHGTLSGSPPDVSYQPSADFNGPDGFTFRCDDGLLPSNVAAVSITVAPVNDPPTAGSDSFAVTRGQVSVVAAPGVLGNDGDIDGDDLQAQLVAPPAHARSFVLNPDGSFSYTHDGSVAAGDSFTYGASDGSLTSPATTVSMAVNPSVVTWYVSTTGDDLNDCLSTVTPCLTIQEAVARAVDGDTVTIGAGVYPIGQLILSKSLTLVGQGSATILDGGGSGIAIGTTGGAGVALVAITLANGD